MSTQVSDDVDELPIIFNGWSIRRIFAGEKTQTRRIVKRHDQMLELPGGYWPWGETPDGEGYMVDCPYGATGDVLWVREAFRLPAPHDDQPPSFYCDLPVRPRKYVADGTYMTNEEVVGTKPIEWGRKRPSIHMPRELCRLRLRVEDVRVERVQHLSQEDAFAEGIATKHGNYTNGYDEFMSTEDAFRDLWDLIHGEGAWVRNDWVWVIEFSVL